MTSDVLARRRRNRSFAWPQKDGTPADVEQDDSERCPGDGSRPKSRGRGVEPKEVGE